MKKVSVKFQLIRDGELYNTVYDKKYEAENVGDMLIKCGWIKEYQVVPNNAIWLKVGD
jgi:hypothetical protein